MQVGKSVLFLGLMALLIWGGWQEALTSRVRGSLPIRYIRTEGVFQYLSKDDVKQALSPLVMTSIFDANMQDIQSAVTKLPWVKNATVERVWPDAIDIKVNERKAYVRWGQNGLLTEHGELFMPANANQFNALMMIEGPSMQEAKTLEIMKGVRTTLADKGFELAEFKINDREAWTMELTSGLKFLLGRTNQLAKLQRFLHALPLLGEGKIASIQVIDLRYPNGFSVTWKPGTDLSEWERPKIQD